MRFVRTLPLAAALAIALLAGRAEAQTTSTSQGSCTGMVTASIGLAATKNPEADPALQKRDSISLSYAPYVFGKAECDCNTSDVFMRLQLSMCLPAGAQGNPTVWVGTSGCSDYTKRTSTNQKECQQYAPSNVTGQSFNAAGGNCSTTTFFDIYVPARALFSPNTGSCDIPTASNQVFIFVGSDQTMPIATCTVPLTEQVTGPTAVANAAAASGDGAITVQWKSPPVGSLQADSYQVLCADANGNPITTSPQDAAYSTCLATGIRRRQNMFGATSVTTGTDGGTKVAADLGLSSASSALSAGAAAPQDPRATGDMGTDDMGPGDLGTAVDMAATTSLTSGVRPTQSGLAAPFDKLDPRYVCSERIPVTAQDYQKRIDGLVNNDSYSFVILAIDLYGNATPSAVYTAIPRPVDDLYARYREAGGSAQGFCFIATAAYGDYNHPQVRVLRRFRDQVLARSAFGRAFIRAYYAASPPLARFIAEGSVRRAVTRALLWPLVGFALLALQLGSLLLAVLVAAGLPALAIWLRRRRVKRRTAIEALA